MSYRRDVEVIRWNQCFWNLVEGLHLWSGEPLWLCLRIDVSVRAFKMKYIFSLIVAGTKYQANVGAFAVASRAERPFLCAIVAMSPNCRMVVPVVLIFIDFTPKFLIFLLNRKYLLLNFNQLALNVRHLSADLDGKLSIISGFQKIEDGFCAPKSGTDAGWIEHKKILLWGNVLPMTRPLVVALDARRRSYHGEVVVLNSVMDETDRQLNW